MAEYDYDLFVIGAGSGGVRASRMAAGYGARVAVAEDRYLGGTCVNVGCIPKKLLSYGAHFSADFADARSYGWSLGRPTFDWATLIAHKDKEIQRLNGIYEQVLGNAGVEIISGRARMADAHTVTIGDRRLTAKHILVATGSWPVVPDFPGREHVITSNEAFFLDALPRRAVVVGGGYIAVEFAGIFHGLGAQTTQLYRGPLFLRGFDQDVRQHLADEMTTAGVDLRFNANVARVDRIDDGLRATLEDGSVLEADSILYATGRRPQTGDLGLENAGVKTDAKGAVIVDDFFQTSAPSVYALGDVIDRMQLTPVAIAEAMVLTKGLFGGEPSPMDYGDIATAVFSHPNIGTVGLTEEEARATHGSIDVYRSSFRQLKLTLTERSEKTLMKLIVDRESDRVLGVHMVGPDAGEVIQGLAVALRAGATKADFDRTVGIHPTAAEEFVTMREPIA